MYSWKYIITYPITSSITSPTIIMCERKSDVTKKLRVGSDVPISVDQVTCPVVTSVSSADKDQSARHKEIKHIIQSHVKCYDEENKNDSSVRKGKPFLKHVAYFANPEGDITKTSIATNWQNLSKEWYAKTYTKAMITIGGANAINQNEFNSKNASSNNPGKCPYLESFRTEQIMPLLKHTNDTGIVNRDGSINYPVLEKFCCDYFEYSPEIDRYILPESSMQRYLILCRERDSKLDSTFSRWYLPTTDVVASAEWNDFYLNFRDCYKTGADGRSESAVTLDTFCQFYYFGDRLYRRTLDGELPVKVTEIGKKRKLIV